MQQHVQTLFQKEMTRKEFLATLGFGVASVMGLSSIIKLTTGKSLLPKHLEQHGYGGSAYGGSGD